MHPSPAIWTSSNKHGLSDENFFPFQWLFHCLVTVTKLNNCCILRCPISSPNFPSLLVAVYLLPLSYHRNFLLPYHTCFCNLFSSLTLFPTFSFLQLFPNFPPPFSLSWVPMCTSLQLWVHVSAHFSLSSTLQWPYPLSGPHNVLCVENSQINISTCPFPQALSYRKFLLESPKVPSNAVF